MKAEVSSDDIDSGAEDDDDSNQAKTNFSKLSNVKFACTPPPLGKKLKVDYEKLHRIGEPIMPLALFDIKYVDMPKLSIPSENLDEEAVVVKFRLS